MANTDNPNGFKLVRNTTGQPYTVSLPIAASQTIAKGDAVIISSGLIEIAVATSPLIHGVAAESVTSGGSVTRADDQILIYPAIPSNIFSGQCSGDSTAALVGTAVDIEGTTGIMEINENATTEDVAQIVGLESDVSDDLALGTNDRVHFIWLRSSYNPVLAAK